MYTLQKKSKCISYSRKKRAKHDGFCSPDKSQIPRTVGFRKKGNFGKSRNVQSPFQKKTLVIAVEM